MPVRRLVEPATAILCKKKGCAEEDYKSGRPRSGIQKGEILRASGVFLSWGIKGTCFINTVLIYALVTKRCISHERNVQKRKENVWY